MSAPLLSPLVCANTIIYHSLRENKPVTPMKLQKLLYLLYARSLALFDRHLFADNFEKWKYGPVLSAVYTEFRDFGAEPIDRFARNNRGEVQIIDESDEDFHRCFNDVWNNFKDESGIDLSVLTHQQDTAWFKVPENKRFLDIDDIKSDGRVLFA